MSNTHTRRFKISDTDKVKRKSLEEIIHTAPFVQKYKDASEQDDALCAFILNNVVRSCKNIETAFEDLCRSLSKIMQVDVKVNAKIRDEYNCIYEKDNSVKATYRLPVLPSFAYPMVPGTVDLLLEKNLLEFSEDKLLSLFAGWSEIETLAYNALKYESKVLESQQDPLTGLLNRRGIEPLLKYHLNALERETFIAKRDGRQVNNVDYGFALVAVDIDYFKKINDTYGHDTGDSVLKTVAKYLQSIARRETDDVARVGGEEFWILLSGGNYEVIKQNVDNLRQDIYEQRARTRYGELPPIPVTEDDLVDSKDGLVDVKGNLSVSMGIAHTCELEHLAGAKKILTSLADERLYSAKETGRNKLVSRLTKLV